MTQQLRGEQAPAGRAPSQQRRISQTYQVVDAQNLFAQRVSAFTDGL
jgi:hypothetical protein